MVVRLAEPGARLAHLRRRHLALLPENYDLPRLGRPLALGRAIWFPPS